VVREVMVPRPDMVTAPDSMPLRDVLSVMLEHGFSRLPVFGKNPDNIVGLVYAKDVMRRLHNGRDGRRGARLKDLLRPAFFVPESKKVSELLREMQTRKSHMAIVVDEYGDVAGLVTMEDLLEEIVGEIHDEYDRVEPPVEPVDEVTIRVRGSLSIDDLSDTLGVELPATEWDTVGGLMAGMLGHLPKRGEEVELQGVRFRAERVQGRRIAKVLVTRLPETAARG
jgi:CBS domain containing-hemolysin-like protein